MILFHLYKIGSKCDAANKKQNPRAINCIIYENLDVENSNDFYCTADIQIC